MPDEFDKETRRRIDKLPESYRWQLVESFRARSDESANYLRALLLAISSGSIAFLVHKHYGQTLSLHHLAIVLLAASVALIIWSWDRQKTKSIQRLMKLRDEGYQEYLKLEEELAKYRRNELIDRWSYALIGLAFGVELLEAIRKGVC